MYDSPGSVHDSGNDVRRIHSSDGRRTLERERDEQVPGDQGSVEFSSWEQVICDGRTILATSWWEGGGSASHAVRTPLLGLCSDRGTDCDRIGCLFCSHDALIRKP